MKKTMVKDFFREIWKTKNRFLSILAIVALGSGFFAGINVTTTDMKLTASRYYDNYNLMDFHLQSTYGITEDDITAFSNAQDLDIQTIMPAYSKDVIANPGTEQQATVKVLSYGGEEQTLNQFKLLEGRMPEAPNECVVDTSSKVPANFKVGETVTIGSGSADDPLEDTLAYDTFTVVGVVQTPLYVNFSRGYTNIGNGTLTAFFVVPKESFCMDVYTDVYLTVNGAKGLDYFNGEYDSFIESKTPQFEDFANQRGETRYNEIVSEATEKLEDGKKELAEGEQTQKTELAKARKKLNKAEQELKDGKAELAAQKKTFRTEKENGATQLAQAETTLDNAESQLREQEAELADGKAQFEAQYPDAMAQIKAGKQTLKEQKAQAKKEFTAAEAQLAETKATLDSAKRQLDEGQAQLTEAKATLDAAKEALDQKQAELEASKDLLPPEAYEAALAEIQQGQQQLSQGYGELEAKQAFLDQQAAEYKAGLAAYQEGLTAYEAQKQAAEQQFAEAEAQLAAAKQQLADTKAQLQAGKSAIAAGWEQVNSGRAELAEQRRQYNSQIQAAEKAITNAEQQLKDGEQSLKDGWAEYRTQKADSDKELADARTELADNEKKLADLEEPEWYVWTRDDNIGYPDYGNDADRIKNVSTVLPVFFILIAVLVCLTTMTRMVEERRTQIGTLKALGYGNIPIMAKYLLYAMAATILGCAVGLSVGFVVFPSVLFLAYSSAYNIPDNMMPFHWGLAGICTAVGIICMVGATLLACYKELLSNPATLMRPKAPPAGKKILLERWTGLWKKIPFAMKLTLRNLLRYKKRAAMTIIGIGGCTALMLTGFGMQYGISSIVDKQYDTVMLYDAVVSLKEGISETEKQDTFQEVQQIDGVTEQTFVRMENITVETGNQKPDTVLLVMKNTDSMNSYINLHTRTQKTPIQLTEEGVVLSEKLARVCDLKVGDSITLTLNHKTIEVPVTAICENYVANYVFMTPSLYEKTLGDLTFNCILLNTKGEEYQNSISTKLTENESIMGASFSKDNADNFRNVVKNLNSVVVVIIISAGALAFIVLYNLVNINVAERTRELATLKVLGYNDHETSSYIYRENIICTVLGILLGLFGGIFLEQFVIRTAEVDAAMFAPEIPFYSFLFAGVLTLLFTLVVNVALHFKLKKLDMVESLKSIE